MRSTITSRGQTVVPAKIRKLFRLSPADRLEWVVDDDVIHVIPVRENPIAAFRGSSKFKGATARLLAERAQDRERE